MTDTCLDRVQRHDYERYLTTLFVPYRCRAPLWALYAFNLEIAKTREVTTQATIGLIRLQWWRDAVKRLFEGKADKHDVIQALATAMGGGVKWREADFQTLIDARESDLYDDQPSEKEFWRYCEQTSAPLLSLAMQASGEEEGEEEKEARLQIGQAYAAIGLLRASGYFHAQNRYALPALTNAQMADAIEEKTHPKPHSKTLRLYRVLTRIHLKQLRRAGLNADAPSFVRQDPLLALKLWLCR